VARVKRDTKFPGKLGGSPARRRDLHSPASFIGDLDAARHFATFAL
jgi:hypothetical protein